MTKSNQGQRPKISKVFYFFPLYWLYAAAAATFDYFVNPKL